MILFERGILFFRGGGLCNRTVCTFLRPPLNANELQINPEKSIIFPPKLNFPRPEVNLICNTSSISLCDSAKYLGVTIDSTLNFKPHTLALEKRVSRSVGTLSKL